MTTLGADETQTNSLNEQTGKHGAYPFIIHYLTDETVIIRYNRSVIEEFDDITGFITVPIIQYWAFKQNVTCFEVDDFPL